MSEAREPTLLEICPECHYDLRGTDAPRCQECGLDLAFRQAEQSGIPWCRDDIGYVRGFFGTAWQALVRPRKMLREVYRPVDYRRAQQFRWICIWITFLTLLSLGGMLVWTEPGMWEEAVGFAGVWFPVFSIACVWLLLVFISGVHTYFFHPRRFEVEHQNRTLALSYYASASMLWPTLLALLHLLLSATYQTVVGDSVRLWFGIHTESPFAAAILLALLGYVLLPVILWFYVGRYATILLGRGWAPYFVMLQHGFALLFVHALCLAVLPLSAIYIALFWYSVQTV